MKARILAALLAASTAIPPAFAGSFNNNFDSDPTGQVTLVSPAKWVATGGVNDSGYISLTDNVNSLQSAMYIADLDAGGPVAGFDMTFKLRMGGGSGNAADGFSLSWADNLSGGSIGEEGAGNGLIVAFDIYDNGGGEAPAIDIKVNGTEIRTTKFLKADMLTGAEFVDVQITYQNGLLDVSFKGATVYSGVALGLQPISGGQFAFGARTGGENNNHWMDDLNIETFPHTDPLVTRVRATAAGFSIQVQDGPESAVDPATVSATLDGEAVTGTATKTGTLTTYVYEHDGLFAPGIAHDIVLTLQHGTPAQTLSVPLSLSIPNYTTIPASAAIPASMVNPAELGFVWRVHQSAQSLANSSARAEAQLRGEYGQNDAAHYQVGGADGEAPEELDPERWHLPLVFQVSNVINFSQTAGENNGVFIPDLGMPGIPGWTSSTDNVAADMVTALEFPEAGIYTMIVNSDDGFLTRAGKNPNDLLNPILGVFEGGRGASDTVFYIYIEEAGIYPFRTLWYEGGGGANIEWSTETADGTRVLINDTATNPDAIVAYRISQDALPAYVQSVSPGVNGVSLAAPSTISAILVDAGTTVDAGSVTLKVDGADATATATKEGGMTTVTHTIPGQLAANSQHTVELTYSDDNGPRTVSWSFNVGPLSSVLFAIEAEDFDYDGGLSNPKAGETGLDVNVMPYLGGAYDTLGALETIDFNNGDGNDSNQYRDERQVDGSVFADGNEVNITGNNNVAGGNGAGGNPPINSSDRGLWRTTANYRIGWVGGDWQNYTRVFPDNGTGGWWKVYAGLSHGDAAATMSGALDLVTEGHSTPTQTLQRLGQFSGPASGTWGNNNLVVMRTTAGDEAAVKLVGQQTVRYNNSSGDFDFLIFSATAAPPPSISSVPVDSVKRDAVVLNWGISDSDTEVNVNSIQVTLNGQPVPASQVTVTKISTGATVQVDLSGDTWAPGSHPWTLSFSDSSTPAQTVNGSGTFLVNPYPTPGTFLIEGEDFNYSEDFINGGLSNPMAGVEGMDVNVMPYLGGSYTNLSAIEGIDFDNNDAADGSIYRTEVDATGLEFPDGNEVSMSRDLGSRFASDRGTWTMTDNYRIGWVGNGDWQNYTRDFPEGDFSVWAALSYGGQGAGLLRGSLDMVTSDPKLPNQTVERLGNFDGPGTGGWGRNELIPMRNAEGDAVIVTMGGTQTVRFNLGSGDFDYLLFVPSSEAPVVRITNIQQNANGTITVEWVGGGVLEAASSITGPWAPVQGGDTSPFTFTPDPGQPILFGRIRL